MKGSSEPILHNFSDLLRFRGGSRRREDNSGRSELLLNEQMSQIAACRRYDVFLIVQGRKFLCSSIMAEFISHQLQLMSY